MLCFFVFCFFCRTVCISVRQLDEKFSKYSVSSNSIFFSFYQSWNRSSCSIIYQEIHNLNESNQTGQWFVQVVATIEKPLGSLSRFLVEEMSSIRLTDDSYQHSTVLVVLYWFSKTVYERKGGAPRRIFSFMVYRWNCSLFCFFIVIAKQVRVEPATTGRKDTTQRALNS